MIMVATAAAAGSQRRQKSNRPSVPGTLSVVKSVEIFVLVGIVQTPEEDSRKRLNHRFHRLHRLGLGLGFLLMPFCLPRPICPQAVRPSFDHSVKSVKSVVEILWLRLERAAPLRETVLNSRAEAQRPPRATRVYRWNFNSHFDILHRPPCVSDAPGAAK